MMDNSDFTAMLKNKQLKITPQRIAILYELEKHGHSSIDDIFVRIKSKIPSVSLATIYKNVLAMQGANIIKSIKTPTQKQKYEINKKPHVHLYCKICDKLEDFDIDIASFQNYCEMNSGYSNIDDSSIILNGICPICADVAESNIKELKVVMQ